MEKNRRTSTDATRFTSTVDSSARAAAFRTRRPALDVLA